MAKQNCDKDCSSCSTDQRCFCAVQMGITNQELLIRIAQEIDKLKGEDGGLIVPHINSIKSEKETAPTGSGVATNKE